MTLVDVVHVEEVKQFNEERTSQKQRANNPLILSDHLKKLVEEKKEQVKPMGN